jgi:hypothetical protein
LSYLHPLCYINAPRIITNKMNKTNANAAPEIPLLLCVFAQFINIPPFLYLHLYNTQFNFLCECLYCILVNFIV